MDITILSGLLEIILLGIVFIIIVAAAYYFTKKIAQFKQGSTQGRNMKVIDVLPIAIGQAIYIIKIGSEYHFFTATKEKIEHCGKVEGNCFESQNDGQNTLKEELFNNILFKHMKTKQEKTNESNTKK